MRKRNQVDPISIYALSDPRTGQVRYIGQTNSLNARMAQHKCVARTGARGGPKDKWVLELDSLSLAPIVSILRSVSPTEADAEEKRCIESHRSAGCQLFNVVRNGPAKQHLISLDETVYKQLSWHSRKTGQSIKLLASDAIATWLRQQTTAERGIGHIIDELVTRVVSLAETPIDRTAAPT